MIGFKIQLYPTDEQIYIINKYFGVSRFIYNWVIDEEEKSYESESGFLSGYTLGTKLTSMKKELEWLKEYSHESMKLRIFDAVRAYKRFFSKISNRPKYKSKKDIYQTTCIRSDRLKLNSEKVYCPGIGWIKHGNIPNNDIIGEGFKSAVRPDQHRGYYNTRISFNGRNFFLTLGMKKSEKINFNSVLRKQISDNKIESESLGIDVGCKGDNWIVDSNGYVLSLPDFTLENKKIKRLQKRLNNKIRERTNPEIRSNNSKKVISQIRKYYDRKSNRRKSKLYDYVNREIIDKNPKRVVIENLDYENLKAQKIMNRSARGKINNQVYESSIYETHLIIQYMCEAHNIPIIKADKQFPSSQLCSNCGYRQKIGAKRVYKCPNCGLSIDRDLNAAINLSNYSLEL